MRRMLQYFSLLGLIAFWAPTGASAQGWSTYSSSDFNIQFSIPDGWETETQADADVPSLLSASPDGGIVLAVLAYKDEEISTEALLDRAVEMLDVDLEGAAAEEEINGLLAWVASAYGKIEGEDAGMFIMAATYDENNYIAYIFTPEAEFEANAEVMNMILDSFAPLAP